MRNTLRRRLSLRALRKEAFELVQPTESFVKSLNDELNETARMPSSGWIVQAFRSRAAPSGCCMTTQYVGRSGRGSFKTEVLLTELSPDNAIGAVQFFLTSESNTPFSWACHFGWLPSVAGPARGKSFYFGMSPLAPCWRFLRGASTFFFFV